MPSELVDIRAGWCPQTARNPPDGAASAPPGGSCRELRGDLPLPGRAGPPTTAGAREGPGGFRRLSGLDHVERGGQRTIDQRTGAVVVHLRDVPADQAAERVAKRPTERDTPVGGTGRSALRSPSSSESSTDGTTSSAFERLGLGSGGWLHSALYPLDDGGGSTQIRPDRHRIDVDRLPLVAVLRLVRAAPTTGRSR